VEHQPLSFAVVLHSVDGAGGYVAAVELTDPVSPSFYRNKGFALQQRDRLAELCL
jgi:hypothetical protein